MTVRYLLLPLALLAGCAATGTTPSDGTPAGEGDVAKLRQDAARLDGRDMAREDVRGANRPTGAQKTARFEHDTEAAHRARHFYMLGLRLLQAKRIDEAIREFQLAVQAYPLFHKAHFKLGYAYYHKGLYDLEIAEYKKCLSIRSNYLPAQLNLGHAYLARDQLELAREAYRKVIEKEPHHVVARYNLGLVEFDLNEPDRAERHLEAFLRTQTENNAMTEQAKRCLERIQRNKLKKEAKKD